MLTFSFVEQEWNTIPKKSKGGEKKGTFASSTPVRIQNRYSVLEVDDNDEDDIDLLLDELEFPMPPSKKMRKSKNRSSHGRDDNGKH